MPPTPFPSSLALALLCLTVGSPAPVTATNEAVRIERIGDGTQDGTPNELDAFMEKVLKRRDVNRETLRQYVLDELETFELLGPGRSPLHRTRREFTWYVRDGLHVRSPIRFNGVTVGESAREAYERDWTRRERARLERRKKDKGAGEPDDEPDATQRRDASGAMVIPAPRFVSEAYFMDFKFEPGNYFMAGREQLEGHEVLRIEYYPERMFSDDEERARRERGRHAEHENRERRTEERIERQMNRTSLITLWVDPAEHQIVKYTFHNVWLEFLPAGWIVRVDAIRASMTMGQPFPGVWLPRDMAIHAGVTLANGTFAGTYARAFSEYRQAEVEMKIRIPREPREVPELQDARLGRVEPVEVFGPVAGSGPFQPVDAQEPPVPREFIREIRVHGNAWLSDAEVIRLAGIEQGQTLDAGAVEQIERRLKESGRFETVEVRKRYRSLTSTVDVALVLIVHERPGITADVQDPGAVGAPWRRFRSRLMFLPIVSYADGYGFTYGARFSTAGLLGMGERISTPLTWGATRRAAVEVERTFDAGPLTRVHSSFGIWQRENPHFRLDERRIEWTGRMERHFAGIVRTGFAASRSTVSFDAADDRVWTIGADVALDLRRDPAFPRNAVLLGAGWTALDARGPGARLTAAPGGDVAEDAGRRINRYTAEARGYVGIVGQSVVAARAQYSTADAPLPLYERLLLGGAATLRGFRAGTFAADRTFVSSAELRVPITSVLRAARFGVTAFVDAAKGYDVGQRLADAEWHHGAGGGLFVITSVVKINLDVARGLRDGRARAHLSAGFAF